MYWSATCIWDQEVTNSSVKRKCFILSYILESIQMILSINFHSSAESFK
jgi:hypothetical protein